MANETPPYMNAYGNIVKALNKIKSAQTPPRFTQDFLSTKLNLSGGGARPIIPFLTLHLIEWVDYRMGDERQRAIHADIRDLYAVAGIGS